MAVLGLGADDKKVATKSKKKTSTKATAKGSSQADEAKALLEAMEQKAKDKPDDCVFC